MRVLLVEPSVQPKMAVERDFEYLDSSSRIGLCLPLLAALMPADVETTIAFDPQSDVCDIEGLGDFDLVGVSCTGHSGQVVRATEIGARLKELGVPSVVGGPVMRQDEDSFIPILSKYFDAVAIGEAEMVLPSVIDDARRGCLGGQYGGQAVAPYRDVPLPRFELLELEQFDAPHVFPVQTARGCPRKCTFCSEPLYGPWRYRPVDEVIAELAHYKSDFGAQYLVFRDDDFLNHPGRLRDLLPRMADLGLEWACQTDLSLTRHPEIVELAIDAGMRSVCFGLESIDADNRKDFGKTFFSMDAVPGMLARLNERGVEVQMNIIFGADHDTPELFDRTVDYMLEHRISYWYANILQPEAGTPLYQRLEGEGRLVDIPPLRLADDRMPTIRRSFADNENPGFVNFRPKHITAEQLVQLTQRARERFQVERVPTNVWLPGKHEY